MTSPSLLQVVQTHRDEIVERFVREVEAKALPPHGTRRSLLVDHIPVVLEDLAVELASGRSVRVAQDVFDTSQTSREHGHQRWDLHYDLGALVREYGVLRYSILEAARESGAVPTIEEFEILGRFLNVGVAEAATSYMLHRDEQLLSERENLRFLSEAGEALSGSLDYETTLTRLTKLLVPRIADWCAIRLESTELTEKLVVAHVEPGREKVIHDLFATFPVSQGPPYAYPIVRRAAEVFVSESVDVAAAGRAAPNPEHLELLLSLGVRSWMVVPLGVERVALGTLVLAYGDESGRRYGKTDLELVRDLARRAALAIDNARLYAFSQAERLRVEEVTRAKDSFVATVSHELRTPLNAILGWTRMLRGHTLGDEKRERALEIVERNALAQNQLIADLLDISRITAGKMRLNLAQTDVASVVDIVVESVTPAAEAKRLQLKTDIERKDAVLRADADRLQQVVWNLLTNAVKFTPKDGSILVTLRRVESTLEVTVADTGIGIASEFLPHVFEFFRQSESGTSRTTGGLGIGLAIAKSLVELHGGTLEARSAGLGQGTTFFMVLPISPVVSTSLGVPRLAASATALERLSLPELPGIRVLVVDDESDARELLSTVLETCGVQVEVASTAIEAIEKLRRIEVDVLVSDIGMPGQDGFFLIKMLRSLADERLKGLPALALSAFARPEDRTRALGAGFNAYLTKPVELATLARSVAELAAGTVRDDASGRGKASPP